MFERLFGKSKFLKKMNTLMKIYSVSHDAKNTFDELQKLEQYIKTEGEYAWYRLNKASLLYDMKLYEAASDEIVDIRPLNPEFDARLALLKTKLMQAL